jgi:hypothetical protein
MEREKASCRLGLRELGGAYCQMAPRTIDRGLLAFHRVPTSASVRAIAGMSGRGEWRAGMEVLDSIRHSAQPELQPMIETVVVRTGDSSDACNFRSGSHATGSRARGITRIEEPMEERRQRCCPRIHDKILIQRSHARNEIDIRAGARFFGFDGWKPGTLVRTRPRPQKLLGPQNRSNMEQARTRAMVSHP